MRAQINVMPEQGASGDDGLVSVSSTGTPHVPVGPPQKNEAHRLAGAAGFRGDKAQDSVDSEPGPNCDQPQRDTKAFATLQARYALAGWELIADSDGRYCAVRWGMRRELSGLQAVADFADQVGVPQ